MNFIKKEWFIIIFVAFLILAPVVSFAGHEAGHCDPAGGKICNPLEGKATTIPEFIKILLEGMLKIGIPIVALAVIYSGFLFVFAMGNSEKLSKAKDALLYTMIGAGILLGSWAIAKLIATTVTSLG